MSARGTRAPAMWQSECCIPATLLKQSRVKEEVQDLSRSRMC